MKPGHVLHLLVAALLLCAGCIYEAPLVGEHELPLDQQVLGLWEYVPGEGEQPGPPERMLVLAYSATEYLVHYPVGKGGMYFRAYPIRVGAVDCVQLELIGTEEGPVADNQKKRFHVAVYRWLPDGEVEIRTLNSDLVDDDLKDGEALRAAFLQHNKSSQLFRDPGRFRRIRDRG